MIRARCYSLTESNATKQAVPIRGKTKYANATGAERSLSPPNGIIHSALKTAWNLTQVNHYMTKKHFIALADAIRSFGIAGGERDHSNSFGQDQISALACFCSEQNERFNRELWIRYINGECGKNGGSIKK